MQNSHFDKEELKYFKLQISLPPSAGAAEDNLNFDPVVWLQSLLEQLKECDSMICNHSTNQQKLPFLFQFVF